MSFKLEKSDLWKTWPKNTDVAYFAANRGPTVITNAMKTYFNSLQSSLNELDQEVTNEMNNLNAAILEVQEFFQDYHASIVFNGNFIR